LLDEDPQNTSYQIALARTLRKHGLLCQQQGRPDDALAAYQKAIELYRDLQSRETLSDPENSLPLASFEPHTPLPDSNCAFLICCYEGIGELHEKQGRLGQAWDLHEQARRCGERFLQEQPDSIAVLFQLVEVYRDLVRLGRKCGRLDQALQAHRSGIEMGQRLVRLAPDVAFYRLQLIQHQQGIASLQRTNGRTEQALLAYQEADQLLASVLQQDPDHFEARCTQVQNHYHRGECLHDLGRREEALNICRQAHQLAGQLDRDHPANPKVQNLLADVCFWLGKLQAETQHKTEAVSAFQQGAAVYCQLARRGTGEAKWRFMYGTCLHSAASQMVDLKQVDQAADSFRCAAEARDKACRDAPNNLTWHADTAGTLHRLGELEERLGHSQEALTAYQHALSSLRAAKEQRRLPQFLQDEARMRQKLGRDDKAASPLAEPTRVGKTKRLAGDIASGMPPTMRKQDPVPPTTHHP
jgi:tetratricopeptide (TPR) repeat protein